MAIHQYLVPFQDVCKKLNGLPLLTFFRCYRKYYFLMSVLGIVVQKLLYSIFIANTKISLKQFFGKFLLFGHGNPVSE